jgi:hypothetical protein
MASWMTEISLCPAYSMDRQFLISQQTNLISSVLLLLLEVLVVQFTLIFEHLLEGVAQLSCSIAPSTFQFGRNINYPWTAELSLLITCWLEKALRHRLLSGDIFIVISFGIECLTVS